MPPRARRDRSSAIRGASTGSRRFAEAPTPLVEAEPAGAPVDRHARLRLCDAGREVLRGRADHVSLNGVDRWIGGVHLTGRAVPWRWDDGIESIVPVER